MERFYKEYGHLYIQAGYTVDGHDVYLEFCMIRSRRNMLSKEYLEKYEKIGMDWDITTQWMTGFWAAEAYFCEFGDLNSPSTLGEYHGVWLYDWLKRCREKQDYMIDRQKYMLNSIGMNWTIGDPYEEEFEILVEYRNGHGHCDVPGDEGVLGRWVRKLRERPPEGERKYRLDALGSEWDGRKDRSNNAWRAGVEKSGNLKVPKGYACDGGDISLVLSSRGAKRDKRMDELEKICSGN